MDGVLGKIRERVEVEAPNQGPGQDHTKTSPAHLRFGIG